MYSEQFGVYLPDYGNSYTSAEDVREYCAAIDSNRDTCFVVAEEPNPGAAILLRIRGWPIHVGFFAGVDGGHPHMIHTTRHRGHSYRERVPSLDTRASNPEFFVPKGLGLLP